MESHGPQPQHRFAGLFHAADVPLETRRGGDGAKFPGRVDINRGATSDGCSNDASDKSRRHVSVANPDRILITSGAKHTTANDDVVAAGGEVGASSVSQGNVEAAGGIVVERIDAIGRVAVAGCVLMKRTQTVSRVEASLGIHVERGNTGGCVLGTSGVALEHPRAGGRVVIGNAVTERGLTDRGV